MATLTDQYFHIQKMIRKHLSQIEKKLISHEKEMENSQDIKRAVDELDLIERGIAIVNRTLIP